MEHEILHLSGVDTYYGDSHVLHGVSFGLKQGRVLGLLGRNGSGKTTCISSIVGFLPPKRGVIRLFDTSIESATPEQISKKGLGLVPQGRRIFRTLSVQENLSVAARRRSEADRWNIARIYELFPRLAERSRNAAGTLSGGEQQMLAIGRALMGNPRVLLLDEPSEGLAPQIVNEVANILMRLKQDGMSIVLVEQNLKLALSIADDIVVLASGEVVFQGEASFVRKEPEHLERHLVVA